MTEATDAKQDEQEPAVAEPADTNAAEGEPAPAPSDSHEAEEPIVEINHVHMVFNIANQQLNSLKEYFIAIARHQLMFREFVALDDVTLNIYPGERYGFVGVNGSGKSTLLKCIAGVLEPTTGYVRTRGSMAPLIELGAGFDMELTARENTYLNGALLGYSKQFIDEHFDDIVDFAEVRDFIDMPLKNYSSGMVARIAFAIATVTEPDILVVDEALSVGDFMFQEKCEKRIDYLVHEHGTTLLFVSHIPDQVRRVCNKALWLDHGKVKMVGDVNEVCDAYEATDHQ
jgi:ABC-2 type transport system ATP-binding protein